MCVCAFYYLQMQIIWIDKNNSSQHTECCLHVKPNSKCFNIYLAMQSLEQHEVGTILMLNLWMM